jgi:hypothetical protein
LTPNKSLILLIISIHKYIDLNQRFIKSFLIYFPDTGHQFPGGGKHFKFSLVII